MNNQIDSLLDQDKVLDGQALDAAKALMGDVAWPTVILGFSVVLTYISMPFFAAQGSVPFWIALVLMAFCNYAAYTVLHDSAHGSISGSHKNLRWLNELLGFMTAWIMLIPLTAHRHEHLAHHRNTNNAEADPDYVVAQTRKSVFHLLHSVWRILCSQAIYYRAHRWTTGPKKQNFYLCLEVAAQFALRFLIIAICATQFDSGMSTLILMLSATVIGTSTVVYLFAYIVHRPHTVEGRYVDTSTILVDGPLSKIVTVLWGFQNYHSIHHLFPRVPFYRYRRLFDEIQPVMVAKQAPIYNLSLRGLTAR